MSYVVPAGYIEGTTNGHCITSKTVGAALVWQGKLAPFDAASEPDHCGSGVSLIDEVVGIFNRGHTGPKSPILYCGLRSSSRTRRIAKNETLHEDISCWLDFAGRGDQVLYHQLIQGPADGMVRIVALEAISGPTTRAH